MGALLISYDLKSPGQDYTDLHDAIKSLGGWWHYLDSTWIVSTTLTPAQAWAELKAKMDTNDRLLVIDVTGKARSGWLPKKAWEWLTRHI
ncbi:hypothetical protein [Arthrobacter sp. AET 35A]|uniref:hypothetical protein n=1 Tax=Arthrobacter sp. AET 35A TaxID=2292643 RepID=UPI001783698D|nr:hypothetical protein [Arthrobacter sp. AET 35A]MBE0011742.1 hypothetical protein [Arthrobacter sp. AET 35A]